MDTVIRVFDRRMLPNLYLSKLMDERSTGMSINYPAWGLLYYSLLCMLPDEDNVIVETGTNHGTSTIILAQALIDRNVRGHVYSFELDPQNAELARKHVNEAGVGHRVTITVGNSLQTLSQVADKDVIFAFLDAGHTRLAVSSEVALLLPAVRRAGGKFYFDNTTAGGVAQFLNELRQKTGGAGLVEFTNCSIGPAGNAIWEPTPLTVASAVPGEATVSLPNAAQGGKAHARAIHAVLDG